MPVHASAWERSGQERTKFWCTQVNKQKIIRPASKVTKPANIYLTQYFFFCWIYACFYYLKICFFKISYLWKSDQMSEVGKIITIVSGQLLPVQNFTAAGRSPNLAMNEDQAELWKCPKITGDLETALEMCSFMIVLAKYSLLICLLIQKFPFPKAY